MPHYPEARERGGPLAATLTDRFRPPDTTAGYVTLTDTAAEIIRFARDVARIKVLVLDNDATLLLHARGAPTFRTINVPAGAEYDEGVAAEIVEARNRTAGLNARVQVQGFYV